MICAVTARLADKLIHADLALVVIPLGWEQI